MSKDPTFRVLGEAPTRAAGYEAYRREWDRREAEWDPADHPVHVDIESVAVCEMSGGRVVWEGEVQTFDLIGHPTTTRA